MKNKKMFILLFTTMLIILSSTLAFANDWGDAGNTIQLGDTQIKFKDSYDNSRGYNYNGYIFTKDYHQGQYGIYSPIKAGDAIPHISIRRYLKENTQIRLGRGGEHLVGDTWWSRQSGHPDYNLKKGSSEPGKYGPGAYNGDNTGTFEMFHWKPLYPIKRYEYRYIGYTKDGVVVDNPYFPADVTSGTSPELKHWKTFEQINPSYRHGGTSYNDKDDKAKRTFEQWFSSTVIGEKFKLKAIQNGAKAGEEWSYWNKRMAILTDIDDGAGLLKGWHSVGGHMYYQTFAIPKPPENNITILKLELIDPDTDEVINAHIREVDENDIFNVDNMNVYYTNHRATIEKGKKYKVRAEYIYNSKKEDANALPRATNTGSIELDRYYTYDENIEKYNVFDATYLMKDGKGLVSNNKLTQLKPGEKAYFEWEYQVPDSVNSNVVMYIKVPDVYTQNSDDLLREDNWLNVSFTVAKNDIGFIEPVELYNSANRKVDFIYPNEAHTVKFNLKHFLGSKAVGLDPNTNPKATIDVEIKDGNNNIIRKATLRADEVLNPNGQIAIDVKNIATPTTKLKACATINSIHKEKGFNSNPSNDTICEIFAQTKNYAIKDLKVSPHFINVPNGVSSTNQMLNFRFVVAHEGQDGYGSNPTVVIRQGGRELTRASVSVPAGSEITEVWALPVNLRFGKNDFEVEVNPAPRTVEEFRSTGLNPYEDNKKTDSVVVRRNPECIDCEGVRTRNTWSEIFDMHEHLAHREYYTCCYTRTDSEGNKTVYCRTCSRCVTDSDRYWTETNNFYEEYKIENVFFRSKWSKDTRGGDGWVDLLTSEGKIKSGYGFELKIVTKYETNRGSRPPVPNTWRRDCSYLSRYPGIGYVSNPNIVSLKIPYKDSFGNNVCYILNAENSRGSWTNNRKDYQLPWRDSFNIKNERKIYINEKAKPGIQQLQIVTQRFDGYDPDAPVNTSNKRTLQDCKTVEFEILANDDLKSHIVQ